MVELVVGSVPAAGRRAEYAIVGVADVFGSCAVSILSGDAAAGRRFGIGRSVGGRGADVGARLDFVFGAAGVDRRAADAWAERGATDSATDWCYGDAETALDCAADHRCAAVAGDWVGLKV